MSSVSGADRSENRDVREEYQDKEVKNAKKQAQELKRLRQKQSEELSRLTESFNEQIQELRNKNKEILSERDENNQKQVDQVRQLYRDQFKSKAEKAEEERRAQKEAYSGEMNKQKLVTQQQKEIMKKNFDSSLKEKDRALEETSENSIEGLQDQLKKRTDQLNEKHAKELTRMREDRDQGVYEQSSDKKDLKSKYANELADLKRKQSQDAGKREDRWMSIYQNEQRKYGNLLNENQGTLRAEREEQAEKLANKMGQKREKIQADYETFKDEITDRTETQLRGAKLKAEELRLGRTADLVTDKKMRELDRRNLQTDYENKYQDLYKQRDQIYDVVNAKALENIEKIKKESDRMLSENNFKNQSERQLKDTQSKEDRHQLVRQFEQEMDHTVTQGDKTYKRLVHETTQAQKIQGRYYAENLDQLKQSYAEHLQDQREKQLENLRDISTRMEKKFREQTSGLSQKIEEVTQNYEVKLDELKQGHQDQVKRLNMVFEQRAKDREKAIHTEKQAIEMKYESRLALQEDLHSKEIDRLEKKHQEQMSTLASRMNAINKKA